MSFFYRQVQSLPIPFNGLDFLRQSVTGVMAKNVLCFQNVTCAFSTTPLRSPPSLQAITCKATPAVEPWERSVPAYCRCWDAGSCPHTPANREPGKPLRESICTLQPYQSHFSCCLLTTFLLVIQQHQHDRLRRTNQRPLLKAHSSPVHCTCSHQKSSWPFFHLPH